MTKKDSEGIGVSTSRTGANGDIALVSLNGFVDTITSPELERSLDHVLSEGSFRVVIDLSNVDYVSSAGWGIFVSKIKGIREEHGDLILVGMKEHVYEVFALLEFTRILKAFASIGEAVEEFDGPKAKPESSKHPVTDSGNGRGIISESKVFEVRGVEPLAGNRLVDQAGNRQVAGSVSGAPERRDWERKVDHGVGALGKRSPVTEGTRFSKSLFDSTISETVSLFEKQEVLPDLKSLDRTNNSTTTLYQKRLEHKAELPVSEKVKLVVLENPSLNAWDIRRTLNTAPYGYTKVGWLRIRHILKLLKLATKEHRFRYWRSR